MKLAGEDGNDAEDPRSFSSQGWLKKMVILAAGVAMNVLLAFVIFTGIAWLASPLMGIRFYEVVPNSPAERAGLQSGDAIVAVNGERYQFITGPSILDGLTSRAGETVVITVDKPDGTRRDVTVILNDRRPSRRGRVPSGSPARIASGTPTSTVRRPRTRFRRPWRSAPSRPSARST